MIEGHSLGYSVGYSVGASVGLSVGASDGLSVGVVVGSLVGFLVGFCYAVSRVERGREGEIERETELPSRGRPGRMPRRAVHFFELSSPSRAAESARATP